LASEKPRDVSGVGKAGVAAMVSAAAPKEAAKSGGPPLKSQATDASEVPLSIA